MSYNISKFCLSKLMVNIFLLCYIQKGISDIMLTKPNKCVRSTGKCDGILLLNIGQIQKSNRVAKIFSKSTILDECRTQCTKTHWCLMMKIDARSLTCNMYDHRNWTKSTSGIPIYVWSCCKQMEYCYSNVLGRCAGYWISYVDTKYVSENDLSIQKLSLYSKNDCWESCILHLSCISVSYDNVSKTCELYSSGSYYLLTNTQLYSGWELRMWQCCQDRHVERPSGFKCQYAASHPQCLGKWIFNSSMAPIPVDRKVVSKFASRKPAACLQACNVNSHCTKVFYHPIKFICILLGSNKSVNNLQQVIADSSEIYNLSYQSWEFSCCISDIIIASSLTAKSKCFEIVIENCITVEEFNCSNNKSTYTEKRIFKGMAFNYHKNKPKNLKYGVLISNGYKIYLANVSSSKCLKECDYQKCKVFSGAVELKKCPNIVSRSEWHGSPPIIITKFTEKPKYVIILNTVTPSCLTIEKCSESIRSMQQYHMNTLKWPDIGYNFLVGEDGNMYEGRGWETVGAHSLNYNRNSIGIAFIGWFKNQQPSLTALKALKKFIQCGVDNNHIIPNYTLVAQRDLTGGVVPGKELWKIISNWPHYLTADNNLPSADCDLFHPASPDNTNISPDDKNEDNNVENINNSLILVIVVILISIIIITCVVSTIVWYIYHSMKHKTFCRDLNIAVKDSKNFTVVLLPNFFLNSESLRIKQACNVKISIAQTKFYFLIDKNNHCDCVSVFENLIYYCAGINSHDICNYLTMSSYITSCKSSKLLLLSEPASLFGLSFVAIVHFDDASKLRSLAPQLPTGNCICRDSGLLSRQLTVSINPTQKYRTIEDTSSYSADWSKTIREFKQRYQRAYHRSQHIFYDNFVCVRDSETSV